MTLGCHLAIGPLRWDLHHAGGSPFRCTDPAYAGFLHAEESSLARPALRIARVVVEQGPVSIPEAAPLFSSGRNWSLWEQGCELLFVVGAHRGDRARVACCLDRQTLNARLTVEGDPTNLPLVYPLDQILSWAMLAHCGGLLLHAAVAVKAGVGYVFAGRSGAGKSTLSGLCHGEGWRILNDDRSMVFRRDGSWRVAGTPWHGSGRFAEADEVPLGGLYLLRQAADNRLERIDSRQARMNLLDVTAVPWFEDHWSQRSLDVLDDLSRTVPVECYHFAKSLAAVRYLEQGLSISEEAAV